MMHYYLVTNVNSAPKISGFDVAFEPIMYMAPTNSTWGALATEDEALIAALAPIAAAGRVIEVDEDEYQKLLAKKKNGSVSPRSIVLPDPLANLRPTPVLPAAVEVKPAAPLEDVLKPRKSGK